MKPNKNGKPVNSQYRAISEIGQRLRAHRIGAGMSPDDVSKKTGISRAAIYRYESGQPIRVDALGKLADLLNVSLTSLFGVGSENIATALSFFERMRQIEESADQISVMFGPISYLLTTTKFDGILGDVLIESLPKNLPDRHKAFADVEAILQILKSRKENYNLRRPNIVSLVSAGELEQFLGSGFIGCANPKGVDLKDRRQAARYEVENIIGLLEAQPMGVQIGVVIDSLPGTSYQIFRQASNTQLAISPFRLGAFANVRIGVATITSATESVELYTKMTEELWRRSLKGKEAANTLRKLLNNK